MLEVWARRIRAAEARDFTPGINWDLKVDGKMGKRRMDRLEEGRNVKSRVISDFAYAEDTGIVGEAEEVVQAEEIFALTEGLRVTTDIPPDTNVPFLGESSTVKHVGALLSNPESNAAETSARISKGLQKLGWAASAWTQGRGAHRNKRRVRFTVRIKVMKTVVKGVLGSFSKTRGWQMNHLQRAQKVINMAIRRCLGGRLGSLHRQGLSNTILQHLTQWEFFETMVRRATLMWVGHVARMTVDQPQKAIMYGWLQGAKAKPHAPSRHAQWINSCFKQAGIPESDWFRLAQHRDKWKQLVYAKFPPERVCSTKATMLDNWRPGRPVPQFAQPHGERVEQNEEAQGSDEDIGRGS